MKIVHMSGSRKRAMARATVKEGKGIVRVNGQILDQFSNWVSRMRIKEPLVLAGETAGKVNIEVNVHGGGWSAQSDAVRVAIARSLAEFHKPLRKVFLEYDRHLIVPDIRQAESSKPNKSKPRKKRQKSYR